ncbi:unnamed protein product [Ceratitis capitata]|uniref:(Mediterranean fruit fly) hypothetical protein n=1 Tax=Ceratitis capitata TaxID=7213 RepID=A0A811UU05_CERCA|nr:unnamed protein product [Ceratitis capitata]
MSRHTTFDLLADVPEFNGKAEELDLFILHIDELRKITTTTEPSFLKLLDLRIRNKIIGSRNVNSQQLDQQNPLNNNSNRNFRNMQNCGAPQLTTYQRQEPPNNYKNSSQTKMSNTTINRKNPSNVRLQRDEQLEIDNIETESFHSQATDLFPL